MVKEVEVIKEVIVEVEKLVEVIKEVPVEIEIIKEVIVEKVLIEVDENDVQTIKDLNLEIDGLKE